MCHLQLEAVLAVLHPAAAQAQRLPHCYLWEGSAGSSMRQRVGTCKASSMHVCSSAAALQARPITTHPPAAGCPQPR